MKQLILGCFSLLFVTSLKVFSSSGYGPIQFIYYNQNMYIPVPENQLPTSVATAFNYTAPVFGGAESYFTYLNNNTRYFVQKTQAGWGQTYFSEVSASNPYTAVCVGACPPQFNHLFAVNGPSVTLSTYTNSLYTPPITDNNTLFWPSSVPFASGTIWNLQ